MEKLKALRQKCITEARRAVAESVNEDNYVVQAISNIEELAKTINSLASRIREWYSLYFPEGASAVKDNEAFIRLIGEKKKEEWMKELGLQDSMGKELQEKDIQPILKYAESTRMLQETKKELENYLESTMSTYCWNMQQVAGTLVGAKLLAEAGSLKKMALMPSTSIQLLGAEKALFRHLKTGAKPPKYGHIFSHPLIQKTNDEDRGKVARVLADKIALAVRADYFGEKFIGEDLRKELEEKFE